MTYNQFNLEQLTKLKQSATYQNKSLAKAYAMWALFGIVGGHRYYIGDTRMAIQMSATLGGLGIWTLLDAFRLPQRVKERNRELKKERQQINIVIQQKRQQRQAAQRKRIAPLRSRQQTYSMTAVDQMDGEAFEKFLRDLLQQRGYSVQLTAISGDFGADLILLSPQKKRIAVQAKRYNAKVGIRAVQEIASAKSYYKADECWVITNNFFTEPAITLAAANKVKLIDRAALLQWMKKR